MRKICSILFIVLPIIIAYVFGVMIGYNTYEAEVEPAIEYTEKFQYELLEPLEPVSEYYMAQEGFLV